MGIFTVVSGVMVGILSSVSDVSMREEAKSEIAQQSQAVVNAIKAAVSGSSYIDIADDTATDNLKLTMELSAVSPTYIYLENGVVYKKETDSGTPVPLTTSRVSVSALSFIKAPNPPGPDTVQINMTIGYNSDDAALSAITRSFRSAVARVSAVTFDSDLLPSSDNTYNVGSSNPRWLNGYFSGNVDVDGILYIGTATSDPAGANGALYYNTTSGVFKGYKGGAWTTFDTGGGGTPGGSDTQVQFNNSSSFGGDAGFTYSSSADRATLSYASTTSLTVSSGAYLATGGGEVGVGITAPVAKLHAKSGANAAPGTSGTSGSGIAARFSGADNAVIDFGTNSGTYTWIQSRDLSSYATNYPLAINPNGGSVGIASTTPFGVLSVENTGSGVSFAVNDVANDPTPFVIDASGKVAIGTSSVSGMLHVRGADGSNTIIDTSQSGASDSNYLRQKRSRGTADVPTAVQTEDVLGYWATMGYGASAYGYTGYIYFKAAENFTDLARGTDLYFAVTPASSASPSTALFIKNNGNVGIGTTAPSAKLEVAGDVVIGTASDTNRVISRLGTYSSGVRTLTIRAGSTSDNTSGTGGAYITLANALNAGGAYGDIGYYTNDGGASSANHIFYANGSEKMRITNTPTLSITNNNESITLTNFTQALTNAGINIITNYTADAYTPGIFWSASDNSATKPKAGIWMQETASGTNLFLGTSNSYSMGITNSGLKIDYSGNGTFVGSVTGTAFYYSSDERLKKEIKPVGDALSKVLGLRGVEFKWKESGEESLGFVAQEVEKVLPELVGTDKETGLKSVQYGNVTAVLVEAVKEQQAQIEKLQGRIDRLEADR